MSFLNLAEFFNSAAARLQKLKDVDYVAGGAAVSVLALQVRRIFDEGLDADGADIGRYSDAYMQERIERYKRGDSRRVILTATAQMRNDYSYIRGSNFVGFGFKNPENAKKADDNEKRYKKSIFALSKKETETLLKLIELRVKDIVNGNI